MDAGYGNQNPTTKTQPLTGGHAKTQGSLREAPNEFAAARPDAQLAGVATPNSSALRTEAVSEAFTANHETLYPNV
jgi:hypothetical protein